MKLSHIKQVLIDAYHAHEAGQWGNATYYLEGQPGIGKTAIVHQAAAVLSEQYGEPVNVVSYLLSMREPIDLMGLPVPTEEGSKVRWLPPLELPTEGRGIFFFDELPKAIPMMHNAVRQMIYEKRVGTDYQLPDKWIVVCAGNRLEDAAGDARLPTHLDNALIHIDVEVDVKEWLAWADEQNIHPLVQAFIEFESKELQNFSPNHRKNPTCRAWEFVSDIIKRGLPRHIEETLIKGTIGDGAGNNFVKFITIRRDLPDVKQIVRDPENAPTTMEDNTRAVLVATLARHADNNNIGKVVAYISRLPSESQEQFLGELKSVNKTNLTNHESIRQMIAKRPEIAKA